MPRRWRRALAVLVAACVGTSVGLGCAGSSKPVGVTATDSGADASADTTTRLDSGTADTTLPDTATVDSTVTPRDSAPDSNPDSATADATDGSADAAADAVAEAGSPCPTANATQSQTCGVCGTQTSTCSGSPRVWGPFGPCSGELDGGCVPDAMVTESCGFCGTRLRVCVSDCEYAVSACTGQVASGCLPGSVDFEPDPSCGDAGVLGKARACSATCTMGPPTACEPPPTTLAIAGTPTAVVDTVVDFLATAQIPSLQTFIGCPQTFDDAGDNPSTSYGYVTVTNPSAQIAVVSIWTSQTATGPTIDTEITSYPGSVIPATLAARGHCTNLVTDSCFDMSDPTSCLPGWGGLMLADGNALTVAPSGSLVVYVAAVSPTDQGPIKLSVRTESLQ